MVISWLSNITIVDKKIASCQQKVLEKLYIMRGRDHQVFEEVPPPIVFQKQMHVFLKDQNITIKSV